MRKVGRPSKFKEKYCEEIVEFCKEGAALVEYAAHIGVSRETLHEWARTHEEFSYALGRAKQAAEAWWTKVGREGLFMGGKDNPFNSAVYNFSMAARFGWSQKQEVKQENRITLESVIDESFQED